LYIINGHFPSIMLTAPVNNKTLVVLGLRRSSRQGDPSTARYSLRRSYHLHVTASVQKLSAFLIKKNGRLISYFGEIWQAYISYCTQRYFCVKAFPGGKVDLSPVNNNCCCQRNIQGAPIK